MGAQVLRKRNVAGFLEDPDEIARLLNGVEGTGRVAGIGAQVAVSQFRRGK
jgi:hypothetical protein